MNLKEQLEISKEVGTMRPQRLLYLDQLKGWGIAFIVLGHIIGAGCHLSHGLAQSFCEAGFKYLYAFHVPLFFFIAGLTYKVTPWGDFFRKKFKRLLLPYLFFGIASILLYAIIYTGIAGLLRGEATTTYYEANAVSLPLWQQVANLFLGGFWSEGFAANSVLWFIPVLFVVELSAQLLGRWLTKKWQWGLVALLVFLTSFFVVTYLRMLPFGVWGIAKYLPWFILGMLLPKTVDSRLQQMPLPAVVLTSLIVLYFTVLNPWQYYATELWQYVYNGLFTALNIGVWLILSTKVNVKLIAYWGMTSLGIMLMHKFPVLFFQNLLPPMRKLFTQDIVMTIVGVLLVFCLTMICCAFGTWVLQRYLPWMLGTMKDTKR